MSQKPDYKNTLNLPRTEFPMQANLVQREPQRLAQWDATDIYGQIQRARADAPAFVLHDGPPFANGDVHIGTALNKILKDLVLKSKSLRGFRTPYVPGWDCHGLPIEAKVTQEFRAAGRTDTDTATLRTACDVYARKYIDLQRSQFRRLGVFGDWTHPYLTLDKRYEADELRMFADIVAQGFVYRGKKPVYWSIPFKTALAEAEVEYRDHISQSVYVKFRLTGEPNTFVLIWTTTPWTLPANLAVAFNPRFHYSYVFAAGDTYLLSNSLISAVATKCGWDNYQITRTVDPEELASLSYDHPFCERSGRLHPAEFVDNSTGTGFVHIAPGHGTDDYGLGRSLGLPVYCPVDDDGRLAHTGELPVDQQFPAVLLGKSVLEKNNRSEANEAVLALLETKAALVHREDYPHSYPHCWRSKTPIVFRAVDQWFIRIDHPTGGETFRQLALNTVATINWVPDWGQNRIKGAIESRPDWCISRQRTWGVPIPAFYDAQGEAILNANMVRRAADLIEQHGSNVWFERSAAELWEICRPADWKGPEATAKGHDTLDVWIDSGSSSRAVLMRREELAHRVTHPTHATASPTPLLQNSPGAWVADVYLEGSDQHRGWFQSSLLLSLAGNGTAPFKTVLTHGFMVKASKMDPKQKEKVSKSAQGTYEKPETAERYLQQFGADVIRLWVASQDFRGDIWVGDDRVEKVGETYRLIRNTLRYQLSNLFDFIPEQHAVRPTEMTGLDRWVLSEFARLEHSVAAAYERYEFHVVYQLISQFAAVQLSSVYHDVIKDRLYTDSPNSPRRRSTQTALHSILTQLCQMLAPMLAFTAEEAWEFIPGRPTSSVHLSLWEPGPSQGSESAPTQWDTLFALRERALPELEKARQAKTIGKSLDAVLHFDLLAPEAAIAQTAPEELRELTNTSAVFVHAAESEASAGVRVQGARELDWKKCERCWHWEPSTGWEPRHPGLCARCAGAVDSLIPQQN